MAGLLILVAVACQFGFARRRGRFDGIELLDTRQWYSPAEAADVFAALDRLDPGARQLYALTELTLDMVFPVAYGTLIAISLFRLFEKRGTTLMWLPLAAAGADILENLTVSYLALPFDGEATALAWIATSLTAAKSGLILASLVALLLGVIWWLVRTRASSG